MNKSINIYQENVSPYEEVLQYTSIYFINIIWLDHRSLKFLLKELKLKKNVLGCMIFLYELFFTNALENKPSDSCN